MAQTIFIRLLSSHTHSVDISGQQAEWCLSDGIGRPTVQIDSFEAILQTAAGKDCILLVPSDEVVLAEVSLPIRQRSKLLQAVPYALEEQIAEDVEKLHFAIAEKQANGKTAVFAVSHHRMQQWMSVFESAGITPKAIIPDILCLQGPVDDMHWAALVEGAHTIVRTGQTQGFTCDTEALPDYLSLAEAGENLYLKAALINAKSELELSALPIQSVDIDTSMRYGLEAMRLTADISRYNLLQGRYASQKSYDSWWKPLQATAALLVAAVLLSTASHAIEYFRLKSELSRLESSNIETMARLFPEIKTLVPGSEKIQLERRLDELRGNGSGGGLFLPLSVLAESLQAVGNLSLQELQLRDSTLFVNLVAKDISTLERLKSYFEKRNDWSMDVQSANASSDGVQIRASLKGAGT